MLTYALVAGPAIPDHIVDALHEPDPPDLAFRPSDHVVWSNTTGTVLFAAWQDGVDLGIGNGYQITPQGLTAFTGHLWPRTGGWPTGDPWVSQLAQYLQRHPLRQGPEGLLGVFTAVSLDADGVGVVATDTLGTSIVYRAQRDGFTILCSRARLAATLADDGRPHRDVMGACWLTYSEFPIGPRTGFDRVEAVPFGCQLEVRPDGVRTHMSTPPWRARLDVDRSELVNGVYDDIATSARAALAYPVPRRVLELTGGKDSRLILAVLLGEGLAGEFEYMTFGAPDLPDVVIAKELAARFRLHHYIGPDLDTVERSMRRRQRLAAEHPDLSHRELELRTSVGLWCAMRNAWELHVSEPPSGDRVTLTGLYGETLSTNYPSSTRLRTHAQLRQDLLVSMKLGMAGILRPEALAHYQDQLIDEVYQGFSSDDPPQDVMDAFYLRHRLHRWLGTTFEVVGHARVLPLHSPFAVRAAFSLGVADRHSEWLPRELYRRSHEPLAHLPFTKSGWRERVVSVRDVEPPQLPPLRPLDSVTARPPARVASIEFRRSVEATDVEVLRRYLVGDPSNAVYDVLDRPAVERATADFSHLPEWSKRQLYGALTAAIWLGGNEIMIGRDPTTSGRSWATEPPLGRC